MHGTRGRSGDDVPQVQIYKLELECVSGDKCWDAEGRLMTSETVLLQRILV